MVFAAFSCNSNFSMSENKMLIFFPFFSKSTKAKKPNALGGEKAGLNQLLQEGLVDRTNGGGLKVTKMLRRDLRSADGQRRGGGS